MLLKDLTLLFVGHKVKFIKHKAAWILNKIKRGRGKWFNGYMVKLFLKNKEAKQLSNAAI